MFNIYILRSFKMNKLLLATILSLGVAIASTPAMAKRGSDDSAGHISGGGHDSAEHSGGHEANEHGGGHDAAGHEANEANEHGAGHEANETPEMEKVGHDLNDDDAPAIKAI
jgi:hypothetical protein